MNKSEIEWIALDWGTTHFRAWAMAENGQILDHIKSDKGMGTLEKHEFEPALLDEIACWLDSKKPPIPALACGMVGAKQGWTEAKYIYTPSAPPANRSLVRAPTSDARIEVYILPGMAQEKPADVMRGEETQIAGFLFGEAGFGGVICLPGTHSKWVVIDNGVVDSFTTFMTGEIFGLLAEKSVLRHSVTSRDWDSDAFLAGVEASMIDPGSIMQHLFAIRAQTLLNEQTGSVGRSRLSGLLVGAELRGAAHIWSTQNVNLVGDRWLCTLYSRALERFGCQTTIADGEMMTLVGLNAVAADVLKRAS